MQRIPRREVPRAPLASFSESDCHLGDMIKRSVATDGRDPCAALWLTGGARANRSSVGELSHMTLRCREYVCTRLTMASLHRRCDVSE